MNGVPVVIGGRIVVSVIFETVAVFDRLVVPDSEWCPFPQSFFARVVFKFHNHLVLKYLPFLCQHIVVTMFIVMKHCVTQTGMNVIRICWVKSFGFILVVRMRLIFGRFAGKTVVEQILTRI